MSAEMLEFITEEIRVADMMVGASAFDRRDIHEILQPVRHSVETEQDTAEYEASLACFTRPQRLASAILTYVDAIREKGHSQFFQDSIGIMWEEALAGLREIGASKNALILSGAALRVGGMPPANWQKRRTLVRILNPKMNDLDAKFADSDPLEPLWDYMLINRAAFQFRGKSAG